MGCKLEGTVQGSLPDTLWSLGSKNKLATGPASLGFAKVFSPPDPTASCVSAPALGHLGPLGHHSPDPRPTGRLAGGTGAGLVWGVLNRGCCVVYGCNLGYVGAL